MYNENMQRVEIITSHVNPLIKQARALRTRKMREKTGMFFVEGIHHVGEMLEADWQIEILFYAPDLLTSDFARTLVTKISEKGIRCQCVAEDVFKTIAEKENPQGIMVVVHQKQWRMEDISLINFKQGAALVSPQDPGNVGTILRTMDATGGDAMFILEPFAGEGGNVDPYHPSAVRASMGSIFWKPIIQTSFVGFVSWARKNEYQLIGTSAHAKLNYREARLQYRPWILVLGSERNGLTTEQMDACDLMVSLPMHGRGSSLNLAVAAGVLLYAFEE
jgi:TrmH family RNA methyltransferase